MDSRSPSPPPAPVEPPVSAPVPRTPPPESSILLDRSSDMMLSDSKQDDDDFTAPSPEQTNAATLQTPVTSARPSSNYVWLKEDLLPLDSPSRSRSLIEWLQISSDGGDADTPAFERNQALRMAARCALMSYRLRKWALNPICNVDLIENTPVTDANAVTFYDMRNHHQYRFHRCDIFNTLLKNLEQADEMLPNPRAPTNPWTNEPLTFAQTVSVCKQLVADYGRRGRCPPVLFAAFCAAGYSIRRLLEHNSSLLAQMAIRNCFKELSALNVEAVFEGMTQLLSDAGIIFNPMTIRRWLRTIPSAPVIKLWLNLIRDYYLYINLHIQVRPTWHSAYAIQADVRALYNRTDIPEATSSRLRMLRALGAGAAPPPIPGSAAAAAAAGGLNSGSVAALYLTTLLGPPPPLPPLPPQDLSGSNISTDLAIQLIQQALFRM